MNEPVKHHFIPKVYLKSFCRENGMLDCFDVGADRFYPASPANAATKNNYNTATSDSGEIDRTTMESFYGEFETKFPGILANARSGKLGFEQQRDLIVFSCLQMMRSPMTRDILTWLVNHFPVNGNLGDLGVTDHAINLLRRARNGERAAIDEVSLRLSGSFYEPMSKILESLSYCIVSLRNSPDLLTSDNPVVVLSALVDSVGSWRLDMNLPDRRTILIYPLSPTEFLFGDNKKKKSGPFGIEYFEIHRGHGLTKKLNALICRHARRNIFAKSRDSIVSSLSHDLMNTKAAESRNQAIGLHAQKLVAMIYSQRRLIAD